MFRILKNTVFILSLIVFTTCIKDDYDKNYTTFEEDTIISFLANNEIFSEFYKLLQAEGLTDLLNTYGPYTCFAPTNEAMRKYYEANNTSFESLSGEMRKETVNNALLRRMYQSKDFPEGALTTLNFDSRYLYIHTTPSENQVMIYVNRDSRIVLLDQKVHNGIVHAVDAVIPVNKTSLPEVIVQTPGYTLFSEALIATGLIDSFPVILIDYHQETLIPEYYTVKYNTPPSWKYGYTALLESDSVYAVNNIHKLDELKAYAAKVYDLMYPEDRNISDVTDRRNSLNRFVAYHIIDRELTANEFIHPALAKLKIPGSLMTSQMTTFLPNSLLEVCTGTLFNKRKDGFAVRIISPDNAALNGVFHGIDNILTFDEGVLNDVFNTRIRINTTDLFPEMATNKMRGVHELFFIPRGFIKNIVYSDLSSMIYYSTPGAGTTSGTSLVYADEVKLKGKNDFTIILPPVPPGTYEIRLGYLANGDRGVCQIYIDGKPSGIPLDMNISGTSSKIGWIADGLTEDDGIENDKMMHNRGYMKGPNSFAWEPSISTIRENSMSLRKIIATLTFDKMETHTFRAKSVEDRTDREFQMDYFEFVPLWYLAVEGKD
jgi:uncharacterized surface protein with fasciclin (FAS1) repeats